MNYFCNIATLCQLILCIHSGLGNPPKYITCVITHCIYGCYSFDACILQNDILYSNSISFPDSFKRKFHEIDDHALIAFHIQTSTFPVHSADISSKNTSIPIPCVFPIIN